MKDKKIIATTGLTNTGGIVIFNIIHGIEDKVKFAYHNGEKFSKLTTSIIRYDKEGQHYFNSGKCKYYLNEFIKVNQKEND